MSFNIRNVMCCLSSVHLISFLCIFPFNGFKVLGFTTEDPASWTGKWFPEKPTFVTHHASVNKENSTHQMGEIDPNCDDGKSYLAVDWDGSFADYICFSPRNRYVPDDNVHSKIEFDNIPKMYMAPHFCMQKPIEYRSPLPTFGPHRPLWPKYGEYTFLPKQRWLHSLEHGGIVALYHPCADLEQIKLFKTTVKNCLRRHVISPSRDLSAERPFGLLAWGVRFTTPAVDTVQIKKFIKEHALKGPEKLADEGQFEYMLLDESKVVSNFMDDILCP